MTEDQLNLLTVREPELEPNDVDPIIGLHLQQEFLMGQKFDDIRHNLRSAIGRINRMMAYPSLTPGDAAALIGWKQTLTAMEAHVFNLQTERSKRIR